MFTPFVAIKVQNKERKQKIQHNRIFSPIKNDFTILQSPGSTSPCRSTKSHDNQMKWSTYSFREKSETQKINFSTTRHGKNDQQNKDNPDSKQNLQILIRQSLRRSLINRSNNRSAQCARTYRSAGNSQSFCSERNSQQKQREDILDYLNQLQGKKCVINQSNKNTAKFKPTDVNFRRNKSQQPKSSPRKSKQLQILSDFPQAQSTQIKQNYPEFETKQVVLAIGMAARRKQPNIDKNYQSMTTSGNTNKIAISTTQCLIFSEEMAEKARHSGLYIQNQTNFVRAKKKSSMLNKKVAKFQKDELQQQRKVGDSRIFEFKNNFSNSKNLNLTVGNTQLPIRNEKSKHQQKKEENIKIEGWEIHVGWEGEPAF